MNIWCQQLNLLFQLQSANVRWLSLMCEVMVIANSGWGKKNNPKRAPSLFYFYHANFIQIWLPYIQFLLSCHLLAGWTILEKWGWFLMVTNSKVEQPVPFISRRFWMKLSETVWPAVWHWVITMSPVLLTLKKLLSDRLGAASCHQIITHSTSGGVKVTICSLFMIPKCQWLWDISSCKLKSVSHFLNNASSEQ